MSQSDGLILLGIPFILWGSLVLTGVIRIRQPMAWWSFGHGSLILLGLDLVVMGALPSKWSVPLDIGISVAAIVYFVAANSVGVPWFLEGPSVRDRAPHKIRAFQRKPSVLHTAAKEHKEGR